MQKLAKAPPSLKISKIIKIPIFLEPSEFKSFILYILEASPEAILFDTQKVLLCNEGLHPLTDLIDSYYEYITALLRNEAYSSPLFSYALSETDTIFASLALSDNRQLIRTLKPPIQLQPHSFYYSAESQNFYSMVFGEQSLSFGVQISYPLLYQDPESGEAIEIQKAASFPNFALFQKIRFYIRHNTVPLSLAVEGKKMNLPIRVGKKALSLSARYFQLRSAPFHVLTKEDPVLLS